MTVESRIVSYLALAAVALAILVPTAASVYATSMSSSLTAPTVDGEDLANHGAVTGTDKWWNDAAASGRPKGQTFTTGDTAVWLNALTYQVSRLALNPDGLGWSGTKRRSRRSSPAGQDSADEDQLSGLTSGAGGPGSDGFGVLDKQLAAFQQHIIAALNNATESEALT